MEAKYCRAATYLPGHGDGAVVEVKSMRLKSTLSLFKEGSFVFTSEKYFWSQTRRTRRLSADAILLERRKVDTV